MSTWLIMEDMDGTISLSERGEEADNGSYPNSIQLVLCEGEINLDVTVEEGELLLELSCYHIEDEASDKAFHCKLGVGLDRAQAKQLASFIFHLLEHEMAE